MNDSSRNGIILNTIDGGDTWELQLLDADQEFSQIHIVESEDIWVSGIGKLFNSSNGGLDWSETRIYQLGYGISTVGFQNQTHGWTATQKVLYKTENSGESWQAEAGWTIDDHPRKIAFLTDDIFMIIGFDGIYRSENGAASWEQVFSEGGWSLSFVNELEGWGVSDNAIFHSENGEDWSSLPVPGGSPFGRLRPAFCSDVLFYNEDNGWIVSEEIPVIYTSDGGAQWSSQSVESVRGRLMAIDIIGGVNGWAVGWEGTIIRTTEADTHGSSLFVDPAFFYVLIAIPIGLVVCLSIVYIARKKKRDSPRGVAPDIG